MGPEGTPSWTNSILRQVCVFVYSTSTQHAAWHPCTHFRTVLHRIEWKESEVSASPQKDPSRALALCLQIGNLVVGLARLLVELMR